MKKLTTLLLICLSININAQDTFSIVAVDSITGEIGSAGASCVNIQLPIAPYGVLIICDVIPGIGAINTQASWLASNQQTAHGRMISGETAQQIVDWVTTHDAQNNSAIRQYGVVEYNGGHPRSAGFTGMNCMDYKNHITGPGYSIQGNILLGQQILDSMEVRYLNTQGTLADRLMAALQGANVVGADSRCAPYGLSSLSSYIRVALPTDTIGSYHIDLHMAYPSTIAYPVDPIDSLQSLYNNWLQTASSSSEIMNSNLIRITQNENEITFDLSRVVFSSTMNLELYDLTGKKIFDTDIKEKITGLNKSEIDVQKGIYIYKIFNGRKCVASGKIVD